MKTLSRMMLVAAASALAIAPVAAQAGTRASEGSSVSAPGQGRTAKGEKIKGASAIVLALLGAGLVVAGIVSASSSDDKGQSPGR